MHALPVMGSNALGIVANGNKMQGGRMAARKYGYKRCKFKNTLKTGSAHVIKEIHSIRLHATNNAF